MTRRGMLALGSAALGSAVLGGVSLSSAQEDGDGGDGSPTSGAPARTYRVTVTNLTRGQPFTPPAVAIHRPDAEVFAVGDPANTATQQLAENGNLGPLLDLIENTNAIRDAAVGSAPLVPEADPGDTGNPYYTTLHVGADASATHLTFVSMLVATNDGIVGLDTVPLPEAVNASRTYYANGYDVGTEKNTERFEDLVPPVDTSGSGEATFSIDQAGDELIYQVSVTDVADVVAAHIHCGAVGENGPIGVTLFSGGPTTPDGVLAEGTITDPDPDNACGWESLDDVVAAMRGDRTYVNVHTQANPAGEVRGQID